MKRLIFGCLMAPIFLLANTPSNPEAWKRDGHHDTVRHDMASPVSYAYGGDYVAVLHREGQTLTLKTKKLADTEWSELSSYQSNDNSTLSIHHGTFLMRRNDNGTSLYNLETGTEIPATNCSNYLFFSSKYWASGEDGSYEVMDENGGYVCDLHTEGRLTGGVARGDTLYAVVEPDNLSTAAEVRNYHIPSGELKEHKVLRDSNLVTAGILMPGERVGRSARLIDSNPREDRLCFEMPVLKNGATEHKRSVFLMLNTKLENLHVLWAYSDGEPYDLKVCEPLLLIQSQHKVKQRYLHGRMSAAIQLDKWACPEGLTHSTPIIAYPALEHGRGIQILVRKAEGGVGFWTLPTAELLEGLDLESADVKLHIGGDTLLVIVDDPNHSSFSVSSVHFTL